MNKRSLLKSLAVILVLIMVVGVLPISAFAAVIDYTPHDDYYKVITKDDYDLAPGIVESEIVLNNAAGSHRQVAHVVEVDMSNPYTKVIPSYKGMAESLANKNYGVEIMSKQAAYAEANGYGNVVAAMNISLSWYNSAYYSEHPELVGEPLGYMILDGEKFVNSQGQTTGAKTCVVINFDEKDGEKRPEDMPKVVIRSTADAITGWEEQVIPANFDFLVKDGKNQYSKNHTTDPASRSFVGIKADGTFVMVMNDGRQAPYSTGFNNYEMAEFMLSLGCVQAINGDGGGSSAFLSQRPGEELKVNCLPSDGAERSTTHGILVISTAPATGEFVRASITSENNYYTPGSTVKFNVVGTDLVGTPADIPADAIWQLKDSSYGTINDGIFVSNGKIGEVTAQLIYNGEVKGEKTIGIVWPTDFAFASEGMTIPFGKTVPINLVATYNGSESYVALKDGDVTFTLSNPSLGMINGYTFTANADEKLAVVTGILSAEINGLFDEIPVALGKGAEVVFDFESDNSVDDWFIYDYNVKHSGNTDNSHLDELLEIVTPETGKVHSGNSAIAVTVDYSDSQGNGWIQYRMGYEGEYIELKNAKKLGFWIWMPEEAYANEWDLHIRCIDAKGNAVRLAPVLTDLGDCFIKQDEAGWRYYTADISQYPITYFGHHPNESIASNLFYIQFYNYQQQWQADDSVVNTQGKFTYFIDDITVEYSDATDDADAPVFGTMNLVDGNGNISEMNGQTINYNTFGAEVTVADFVRDNATGINASSAKAYVDGREVSCTYSNGRISFSDVTVANGLHTVKFVICDNMGNLNSAIRQIVVMSDSTMPTVNLIPHNADQTNILSGSVFYVDLVASNIESVKTITVDLDLVNTFNWELEYANVAEGFEFSYEIEKYENVATITIVRTGNGSLSGNQVIASIPVRVWVPKIDRGTISGSALKELYLTIKNTRGILECTDGMISTFTCDPMKVATEMWMNQWNAPSGFTGVTLHKHTAEVIEDESATCTSNGYMGRTFCEVCDSVVDWGTKVPATGHTYAVAGNEIACDCGDVADITGLYNEDGKNYYALAGELVGGWISIKDEWYYFDKTAFAGADGDYTTEENIKFNFDNGRLTKGVWVRNSEGRRYWYGPGYYRDTSGDIMSARPFEIDGKTYLFSKKGYMQTGIAYFMYSFSGTSSKLLYYDCGEDGVATLLKGFYDGYFYDEGVMQKAYQLVEYEGDYYFINDYHKPFKNGTIELSEKFTSKYNLPAGRYTFDADGKMVFKNGVIDGHLYIDGVMQKAYQLVEFEGDYYFVNDYDKVLKNITLELSDKFTSKYDLPAGVYSFDGNGKMVVKHGVIGDYLYIDGVMQKAYQLVECDGDYYFVNDYNKILKNTSIDLGERFTSKYDLPAGRYAFDAEGKMIINHGVVSDHLYINGVMQKAYQLIEFEGDYYFVNDYDKVLKNITLELSDKFTSKYGLPAGVYSFDGNGKMIVKHGVIGDHLYINGVMQKAYQLVEFEGSYYFVNDYNKIIKNASISLGEEFTGKYGIPAGRYAFDADGKMIINHGVVGDHLYINGVMQKAYQLVEFEGDYYFVNDFNKLLKNTKVYLSNKFLENIVLEDGSVLEAGYYSFNSSGKLVY